MNRIRELRKDRGLTAKKLGEVLNVAESTISMYETGKRAPDNNTLCRIADFFGVTVDYILGREVPEEPAAPSLFDRFPNLSPIHQKKIPLLGEIACGEPIFAHEDRESYIMAGTDVKADFCLRCKGDSMIGARILDGDIVFVRAQPQVENGQIAAVIINDEATLKRVFYYPEKNTVILRAENPRYNDFIYIGEEINQIRILGLAIAFQSDVK